MTNGTLRRTGKGKRVTAVVTESSAAPLLLRETEPGDPRFRGNSDEAARGAVGGGVRPVLLVR